MRFTRGNRKQFMPVTIAFIILAGLVGGLIYVIFFYESRYDAGYNPGTLIIDEKGVDYSRLTCDSKIRDQIIKDASNVKVEWVEIDDYIFGYKMEMDQDIDGDGIISDEEAVPDYGYAIRVKVYNLTPNIYIHLVNDVDDMERTYYSSDNNDENYLVFDIGDTEWFRTYTARIYSNHEECKGNMIREFEFTLPRWNEMSKTNTCRLTDMKYEDICKHFTYDEDDINENFKKLREEASRISEKHEGIKQEEETKTKNTSYIIIGLSVGVVIAIIVIIIIAIKKGKNKNEK